MSKPPLTVTLTWDNALEFTGQSGKHEVGMDGSSYSAPSPMAMLALALAGCMAIDLVHILTKGRHTIAGLSTTFTGERSPDEPHRFVKIDLAFTIDTDAPDAHISRAVDLSRTKYCSVWNSLRQDIDFNVTYEVRRQEEPAGQ